ncbi:MAG: hypothetical protein OQK67_02640 [Chlorobium sp.]|nr:hypothetical protein [Chlorobium sp.]MCW8815742.1 hypothetical protein [Chlorobium sp.]MCW8819711.1 hypothetical protein [Ignavibacteriaceae bacterium]
MKVIADNRVSLEQFLSVTKRKIRRILQKRPDSVGVGGHENNRGEAWPGGPFPEGGRSAGGAEKQAGEQKSFSFGSLLRLRTFAFLIAGTVLLVVYINNLLTINALSRENEGLRERIGISSSINAALELELQRLQTIHNISGKAEEMGLKTRITPGITISVE